MKVAITTYCGAQNYGALLQAHALMNYVKSIGHECKLINNWPFDRRWFKPRKTIEDIWVTLYQIKKGKVRIERYEQFRERYLDLTDTISNEQEMEKLNEEFDVFITGSDQVWNCNPSLNTDFFLGFVADDKKKLSYAASFGSENIPVDSRDVVKRYLKRMNHISVREKSGAEIVKSLLGKAPQVVVDPVFLMNRRHWEELAVHPNDEKYVFVYSTQKSERLNKAVKDYSENNNLQIISTHAIPGCKCTVRKDIAPLEFIGYIMDAVYVISTSFHATAFSIIFEKDFCVVPHSQTGGRVVNICEDANLNSCIWHDGNYGYEHIDYTNAGLIAMNERILTSKQYLKESLS